MVRIFMKRKKIPQVCVFLFALYSSFTSDTFPIRRAVTLFHSPLFHMASYTLSPFATLHSPPQLHFPIHNSSLWSTTFSPFWTPPLVWPPLPWPATFSCCFLILSPPHPWFLPHSLIAFHFLPLYSLGLFLFPGFIYE